MSSKRAPDHHDEPYATETVAAPPRRWFRSLMYAFLVTVVGAMIILPRFFDAEWFAREMRNYLAKDFGLELRTSETPAFGWLPSFSLQMRGVEISDMRTKATMVRLSDVRMSLPWEAINKRRLQLDAIEMTDGEVYFPALKHWVGTQFGNQDGPPEPIKLPRIDHAIQIRNVNLVLDEKGGAVSWRLDELTTSIIRPGRPLTVRATLTPTPTLAQASILPNTSTVLPYRLELAAKAEDQNDWIGLSDLKLHILRGSDSIFTPLDVTGALRYRHPDAVALDLQIRADQWPLGLPDFGLNEQNGLPLDITVRAQGAANLDLPIHWQGQVLGMQLDLHAPPSAIMRLSDSPDGAALQKGLQQLHGSVASSELKIGGGHLKNLVITIGDDEPSKSDARAN